MRITIPAEKSFFPNRTLWRCFLCLLCRRWLSIPRPGMEAASLRVMGWAGCCKYASSTAAFSRRLLRCWISFERVYRGWCGNGCTVDGAETVSAGSDISEAQGEVKSWASYFLSINYISIMYLTPCTVMLQ